MKVLTSSIAITVFIVFFVKLFYHHKYLVVKNFSKELDSKGYLGAKARTFILLFSASIMLPIISRDSQKSLRRIVNILVLVFYLLLISLFLLASSVDL